MRRLVSSSRVLVVNKGYEDHPSVGVSPPRARDMNLITAGSHFYSQLSFTLYSMVFFVCFSLRRSRINLAIDIVLFALDNVNLYFREER